jgi:hypothetical protein
MRDSVLRIALPGRPMPQGSKRVLPGRSGGRPLLIESGGSEFRKYRAAMRATMRESLEQHGFPEGASGDWALPFWMRGVPVVVHAAFVFRRPRSHYGSGKNARKLKPSAPSAPPTAPDCDKLARAVGDAGTGVWWHDDAQIVGWQISKRYDAGAGECTYVHAWLFGTFDQIAINKAERV